MKKYIIAAAVLSGVLLQTALTVNTAVPPIVEEVVVEVPHVWRTDYANVVEEAKETGKPILLFITGSDWCTWCKKLEHEVFDTEAFMDGTYDEFYLVVVDFPRKNTASKEQQQMNNKIRKHFGVRSYPTVIILDSELNELGRTGYKRGGPAKYLRHLMDILKRGN